MVYASDGRLVVVFRDTAGDFALVATNDIKYQAGPEKHSVVSTRFKLNETDEMWQTDGRASLTKE